MDFDFTTQDGWKKFLVTVISTMSTVALGLGLSQAKVDQAVMIATTLSPLAAMVAYYIVNQIAAIGKAKAVQAELAIKSDLVKTLATTAPAVAEAIVKTEVK